MEASALRQAGRRGLLPRKSRLLKLQGDERLIALVREGNPSAFEAIVDRYQGRLLGFCRQMLRSTEDAEDVLQEVFVNAYKAMMADNREINLRPWLYRIARNRCLNHLRKPTADARESMDMVPMVEAASTAETVHNREEFRQLLTDVSKLPETQRTALLLREMDGLSYEEIAESMDTTVPSVKSLLVRARMSLSEASEARMLTCGEVRLALAEAAEGLAKISGPVRRHVRDCEECAGFRKQLKADSKAFAMIFPAGPLIALKAFLFTKLSGSAIVGGGSGACAAGGAGTGAAATGAACTAGGAAATGSAAVGGAAVAGGAAATAGLASAAIGAGGGAMSSAIGAKALAGVVTAAVITAGAVEVKNTDKVVPETPAPKVSTISSASHAPQGPAPMHAEIHQPQAAVAISAAVPAKSISETTPKETEAEQAATGETTTETVPPVTEEEDAQIGDAALIEHPAGTSDSTAHIGVGDGEGTPTVPVDPDGIVIVAPADGEGAVGPSGPSGPTGPSGAPGTPGTTPPPPVTTPPPTVEPPPPPVEPPPLVEPAPPAPPVKPADPTAPSTGPAPAEPAPDPAPAG